MIREILLIAVRWRAAQIGVSCGVLGLIALVITGPTVISWAFIGVAWVANYFIWRTAWRLWRLNRPRTASWTEDDL